MSAGEAQGDETRDDECSVYDAMMCDYKYK